MFICRYEQVAGLHCRRLHSSVPEVWRFSVISRVPVTASLAWPNTRLRDRMKSRNNRCPVTNDRFREFVIATGYKLEAEIFGWSFVFWAHLPKKRFDELVEDTVAAAPWWCKVRGAYWDAPEGAGSDIVRRGDHPVVHISWNDTQAYCR
jgi:hypothetical protein